MTYATRILVVDDDPASRGLMGQILAKDGHGVVVASDGAEALLRAIAASFEDVDRGAVGERQRAARCAARPACH